MSVNGKWMHNTTHDNYWAGEFYNSRRAAIAAGRKDKEIKGAAFYVGQCEDVEISASVDAEHVIEEIAQNINDNYSMEFDFGEQFCNEAADHYESLQNKLDKAVGEWLAEHKFDIGYVVKNIELIDAKDG